MGRVTSGDYDGDVREEVLSLYTESDSSLSVYVWEKEEGDSFRLKRDVWNFPGMVTGGGRTTSLVQTLANGDTVLKYAYTDPGEALVVEPVRQELYGYGDPEWKDLLTTYNGETITYDGIGNPLTYTKGRVLTWQNGRRLASITDGNQTSVYTYNAEGIRTSKTVGEETTRYIVNGSRILCEVRPDGTKVYFYYDEGGSLLSMEYGDTMYYYVKNLQGDIVQLIDETGNVAAGYQYDTWGKVTGLTGEDGEEVGLEEAHIGNINPFRYRGYYYDAETGFYYVSSRYYDPEVGRFISPDTTDILVADSDLYDKNLYAYCDNNPVMRKDSSGELWIAAVAVGVATQYAGDVLGNLIAGKSGMDLFTPTSSIGEYVAAGVTALIPGSGIGGSLIRNITSEAIISVERYVTGKSNNLRSSVTNVVVGTLIDTRVESVTNRVTKYVRTKTSTTYSQKANTMRQKNSNVSTNTIRTSAQRSVRWGNRLAKGIEFVFNSIRSALPW